MRCRCFAAVCTVARTTDRIVRAACSLVYEVQPEAFETPEVDGLPGGLLEENGTCVLQFSGGVRMVGMARS